MSRRSEARAIYASTAAALALATLLAGAVRADESSDPYAGGRSVYTKWCAPCHDPGHPPRHQR